MSVQFSINNKAYTVNLASLPADITLNTFIREHAGLTATKFMCQEGGCGVCICAVTGKHPATGEVRTWAVNSCLTLLHTCTDWQITTSEGIGNKRIGYHAIQKRLAKMNGTQCGYCSPGFVMNMYALLESHGGKVTMEQVENSFGGNICRCTGYRPILDAMKSFAVDSNIEIPDECRDIEDLSKKNCPKTGELCAGSCVGAIKRLPLNYEDGSQWFWPKSLPDLFAAFNQLKNYQYMLVAGNTAHGVYRRSHDIKTFIDINGIPELSQHNLTADALTLGANLSLSEAMEIFEKIAKVQGFEYCQQLWQHFDLIANVPVRNTGTLAGNLMIKQKHHEFPSDIFTLFEALNAQLIIAEHTSQQKTTSLTQFLNNPLGKSVIVSIVLKPYTLDRYIFDSYKIMPTAQNSYAHVNAAFLLEVAKKSQQILSARLVFGGISANLQHATSIEQILIEQKLHDPQFLNKVFMQFEKQLIAETTLPDPTPFYKQIVAAGLLYKFLLKNATKQLKINTKFLSGASMLKRPLSSGQQNYELITKDFPVRKPTEKHEGLLQTAGEAIFANDLPKLPNQLWAAFVTAKQIGATVSKIDASAALKLPGVVALYTAKDIPGVNNVVDYDEFFLPAAEQLFATAEIKFHNQPVAVIVAETNALAQKAAALVQLTYAGGSTQILPTLQQVLESASGERIQHKIKSLITKLQVQETYDIKAAGQFLLGLQYHFFMEPHSVVVVPNDGGFQINATTQWMDLLQRVIANFLNIKNNEVQVVVRRLGGGYGGKATRTNLAACAAALAAYQLNRPVRFVQSLESIMSTTGKRWAFQADYEFHVKQNGKIIALRSEFYEDAGYLPNMSPIDHTALIAKNCYEFTDNFKLDGHIVLTDSPSNAPCRAPGALEGIAMIENILEHIAFETGQDPIDVRAVNLISNHKMTELLPRFVQTTEYRQRRAAILNFNEQNRWRKRGLGISVMDYLVGYFGQYPATLAVYHGDGTILVSHGGIEMGQGMNTKIAQVVAHTLNIPLEMVKFEGSNTTNGANAMVTGGSVGSETLCFAIRKCCNILLDRLKSVKEALKDATWQQIVAEAYERKINLIVSEDCKQGDMETYNVCGLCLTEVEVDILTGNYLINRVDILEDAGESLNPNVDIGQIEGAYMMGLGYFTTERIVVNPSTGELKTNRTWNYKPPGAKDIPIDFRIEMLPGSANPAGFMRSKATGEPAICMSVAVVFALQQALQSARNDAGLPKKWVTLKGPFTPEDIVLNAGTKFDMLKLN